MERTTDVRTPDGRTLHVHLGGDPDGRPVVFHHGTPSGGTLYDRHDAAAAQAGLRLIGYDRPGYGGSSPRPGRTVADCAADVAAILDALGHDRFATWGISGGGPHALACAALLPDRCAAAASLAGVAPASAESLDWLAGMGEDNVVEFGLAADDHEGLRRFCARHAEGLRGATGEQIAASLRTVVEEVDVRALGGRLGDYLAASMGHGLAPGVEGWVDDDFAFLADWGFDVGAIDVPVLVWQGRHDLMVPVAHGEWLGRHVSGAEWRFSEDEGHLSLLEDGAGAAMAWMASYTF